MGTTWEAKWVEREGRLARAELERRLAGRLEELERTFSNYRSDTQISRFNSGRAGEWIEVTQDVVAVAVLSRELGRRTAGAFDASVGPLLALWGFGPRGPMASPPTEAEVQHRRRWVGPDRWEVRAEPPALRKAVAGVELDFSSVAKGFAVDALSRVLREAGCADHLVQVGGDLRAEGRDRTGQPWRVGVERPGQPGGLAATVRLANLALSTSGNYRNVIDVAGGKVGHVLDPRTGRPVEAALLAVSVAHPACAESSGWATGLFVLGAEEGLRLAEAHGLAVLVQVRDREGGGLQLRSSSAWRALPR